MMIRSDSGKQIQKHVQLVHGFLISGDFFFSGIRKVLYIDNPFYV